MTTKSNFDLSQFLKKWILLIQDWINIRFNAKSQYRPLQVLGRFKGNGCTLVLLKRDTPGAVATWQLNWIDRVRGDSTHKRSLLITLDNLQDLNRHFQRQDRQLNPLDINRETVRRKTTDPSHGISVSLVGTSRESQVIAAWEIDFIDNWSLKFAEDKKAESVTLFIARRVQKLCELASGDDFDPSFFDQAINEYKWWEDGIRKGAEGTFSALHDLKLKRIVIKKGQTSEQ